MSEKFSFFISLSFSSVIQIELKSFREAIITSFLSNQYTQDIFLVSKIVFISSPDLYMLLIFY
jgi:hypothetical protein